MGSLFWTREDVEEHVRQVFLLCLKLTVCPLSQAVSVSVIVEFAAFGRHGLHARYPSWIPAPQVLVSPSLFYCDNLVLCVYNIFTS